MGKKVNHADIVEIVRQATAENKAVTGSDIAEIYPVTADTAMRHMRGAVIDGQLYSVQYLQRNGRICTLYASDESILPPPHRPKTGVNKSSVYVLHNNWTTFARRQLLQPEGISHDSTK